MFAQMILLEYTLLFVGGAKLEYVNLTFSTSEYMASISGMPDYELAIW